MLFASLIPVALLAISGAIQPAEAAFIEGACEKGTFSQRKLSLASYADLSSSPPLSPLDPAQASTTVSSK